MKDNILQFLYQGKTVTQIIRLFTSSLRLAPADFGNLTEANLMDHYQNIVENTAFCNEVQKLITSIYYELAKNYKLKISGRKKSLVSAANKAALQVYRQRTISDYAAKLNASLATRLVTSAQTPAVATQYCYEIVNFVIEFCAKFGFQPDEAEVLFDTDENLSLLQAQKILNPDYIPLVKDYIAHPKSNGYQSAHIIFRNSAGNEFEFQVRSTYMDATAEHGTALHSQHKNSKYAERDAYVPIKAENVDISKIICEDFILVDGTRFHDFAGILIPRTFLELSNF